MSYSITSLNVLVCSFFVFSIAGCVDHRISIEEFVELEKAAPVTSEMPQSSETAEVWAKHAFVPYRVGPSDVLIVSLMGLNDPTQTMTFDVRVNRKGTISLPLIGSIKVSDKELEDVEQEIKSHYVPAIVKDLSVMVEVKTYKTTNVVVVGAVATPGLTYLHRNECSLLYAVAAAGGLSFDASGRVTMKRVRTPSEAVTYNLLDPVELEAAFSLEPLEAGDIVAVEAARPNTIFVGGLVNLPGPQLFPPGTSVNLLQVLTAAGGIREDLFPKEGTLIRNTPDGHDIQVRVDLKRLREGKDPNIMLAAGDIVLIPETFGTRVMDFINQNIFFRAGVTATYTVSGNATGIEFLNRRAQQSSNLSGRNGGGTTLQNTVDPLGFLSR